MVVTIPRINKGYKDNLHITRDNKQFHDLGEAEWHEFATLELKQRTLKFEMPDNTVLTFLDRETLDRYIKECYGHVNHLIDGNIERFTYPVNLVFSDDEFVDEGKNVYRVSIVTLEEFKKDLASKIMNL